MLTLHRCSTLSSFPSPPPRRGWQRSEHCSQSFAPRITRQHVWVGTPGHHGAQSGSWSPSLILLCEPYEVQQLCVCLPPGHRRLKPGVSWVRTKQETPNALPTPLAPPFLPIAKARGISEDLDEQQKGAARR